MSTVKIKKTVREVTELEMSCDVRLNKLCLENNGGFFIHVPLITKRWFTEVCFYKLVINFRNCTALVCFPIH
jgi:hypothetical protein